MNDIFVVLDSMVIMEYRFFLEYPWHAHEELVGKRVVLVFTRPLIEELNRNKDTHPRGGVRKRCLKAISWITDHLGKAKGTIVDVQDGLAACLDLVNYVGHVAEKPDDRLIEYAKERDPVAIVSHDSTVRLLAMASEIPTLDPLASERLADEEATELERLRKENEVLSRPRPKLSIEPRSSTSFAQMQLPINPDELHWSRFVALTQQLEPRSTLYGFGSASPFLTNEYDADSVRRFKQRLEPVLKGGIEFLKLLCKSPIVELDVRNVGSSPATDVEVAISAPPGCQIIQVAKVEFEELPSRPRKRLEYPLPPFTPRIIFPSQPDPREPRFSAKQAAATFRVPYLLHFKSVPVPSFFVVLEDFCPTHGFGLEIRIIASETPQEVAMQMPIKLTPPSAKDHNRVEWAMSRFLTHFESPEEAAKRFASEKEPS